MLQPNFLPWKGVFDLINRVDTFVFYDDVQYTHKDWRNRNRILTPKGLEWINVPILKKGKRNQLICDTEIDNSQNWAAKQYKTIELNYKKANYFDAFTDLLREIYLEKTWGKISDLNIFATRKICHLLGISCEFIKASDLQISGDKNGEKVIKICQQLDCQHFINGPASKAFMNEHLFNHAGISLEYISYHYPSYQQLHQQPFQHQVSIIDLLFNCGPNSFDYILPLN